VASNADRWAWARDFPSDELEFAPYNVMAVFPTLPAAEKAAADLRAAGVPDRRLSIRTRSMTDDQGARRVAPAVESPTRARDAQVVGRVFTRVVVLAAVAAMASALAGFLVALALDTSATTVVIVTVVAAVAGAVAGAVGGGAFGSMREAEREEGVVVWVRAERPDDLREAARTLSAHGPLRIDGYDAQGRPAPLN